MAAAAALTDIHQCLEWIGFGDVQHCNAIIDKGVFETDIRDMTESFSERSPAANRIIFGMRKDLVAHINDALGPRSPTMFSGPRPR